jgi:hypothetical protein
MHPIDDTPDPHAKRYEAERNHFIPPGEFEEHRSTLEADTAKIFELEERKVKALERIADLMVDVVDELKDANGWRRNRE